MKKRPEERQGDIPLPAALAILVVVAFALLAGTDAPRFLEELTAMTPALEANLVYFTTALVAVAFSFAWVASQYRRTVKLTKQGSRLEALLGKG